MCFYCTKPFEKLYAYTSLYPASQTGTGLHRMFQVLASLVLTHRIGVKQIFLTLNLDFYYFRPEQELLGSEMFNLSE